MNSSTTFEEEMKKNPDCKEADITILQKWCEAHEDLPTMSERDLVVFHHSCNFILDNTKLCIENYFKIRSKNPQFFKNRDPQLDVIKKVQKITGYSLLDGLTNEGYRILIVRLIDTSPSHYIFNDVLKLYTMTADTIFNTQGSCAGDIIIYDMAGTQFGHLPKLSVFGFKNMLQYVQEGLPVRLKGIHLINSIAFVDIVLNMMTPFMKKELLDMFHVTSSTDVLNTLMPSSMLPSDYGGQGESLASLQEKTMAIVNNQREFFIEDDNRRIAKYSESPKHSLMAQSFKKLEVD